MLPLNFKHYTLHAELINNEIYFHCPEIFRIVDLSQSNYATSLYRQGVTMTKSSLRPVRAKDRSETTYKNRRILLINVPGIYTLISYSHSTEAKELQRWLISNTNLKDLITNAPSTPVFNPSVASPALEIPRPRPESNPAKPAIRQNPCELCDHQTQPEHTNTISALHQEVARLHRQLSIAHEQLYQQALQRASGLTNADTSSNSPRSQY